MFLLILGRRISWIFFVGWCQFAGSFLHLYSRGRRRVNAARLHALRVASLSRGDGILLGAGPFLAMLGSQACCVQRRGRSLVALDRGRDPAGLGVVAQLVRAMCGATPALQRVDPGRSGLQFFADDFAHTLFVLFAHQDSFSLPIGSRRWRKRRRAPSHQRLPMPLLAANAKERHLVD